MFAKTGTILGTVYGETEKEALANAQRVRQDRRREEARLPAKPLSASVGTCRVRAKTRLCSLGQRWNEIGSPIFQHDPIAPDHARRKLVVAGPLQCARNSIIFAVCRRAWAGRPLGVSLDDSLRENLQGTAHFIRDRLGKTVSVDASHRRQRRFRVAHRGYWGLA